MVRFVSWQTYNQPSMVQDRKSEVIAHPSALRALSFFSGAMGLDIGLEQAGITTLLACEFDKASRRTITANKPELGLIGDITRYSSEDILAYAGTEDVDIIVGGPPCQAFSTAGKRRGFEDARGNVFLKYLQIVSDILPRYVVIENVRGLLSSSIGVEIDDEVFREMPVGFAETKGATLFYVKKRLEYMGYRVSFNLYNSANFGSPQIRERVVIIGTLEDLPVPYLAPTHAEHPTNGLQPWLTFREAISGIPAGQKTFTPYAEKRLKYVSLLGPGQNWRDLPEELQKEAMGQSYYLGGGKTGFYRRLAWDRPAPTLVTAPAMPATNLAHPEENRPLSVEEYKRVQEFPDEWVICGNIAEQYRQIGNAVPVSLGRAIGRTIVSHHKRELLVDHAVSEFSRYKNTSDKAWANDFQKRAKLNSSNEQRAQMELIF